ncbi:class I histocompatibility antigen, F10 alpha chain-like [Corythoichthys intestinalis]|uniref:class I histocompatibility antigen, F10 alpha chain-like n=1 Tax=Corythoichthys intestinalis TaxID=161448 RepID=UPI0025A62DFF|nr:class I histocompatibility antigen, F10 alpha chain-like [Corythoichthys intestinalis]XP_061790298.1 class I histocompatibility antigen, F10 alpha chain-like [Nerophis lumbriciformis]
MDSKQHKLLKIITLAAFLLAQIDGAAPVIHSLEYTTTGSFRIPKFPGYLSVGYVDGVQISHYDSDSREAKAKQEWMNKITAEEPYYWETQKLINIVNQYNAKDNIEILQERFNQTGGLHMIQHMFGCQWDDETDQVDGWYHMSYNGEDFIWFDWKQLRWIAVQPQAVVTKHKWDEGDDYNEFLKFYMTEECPSYLKKYVSFGRDVLMRTVSPQVSLLQKTAGSPVTCHATGFYPRAAVLFWKKDGQDLDDNVEMHEILPNHDGTFQTSTRLITVDKDARYECVFRLDSVLQVVTPLDLAKVLRNKCIEEGTYVLLVLFVLSAVLNVVLIVYFVVKCKRATRADSDNTSSRIDSPETDFAEAASSVTDAPKVALPETDDPETKLLPPTPTHPG